MVPSAPRIVAAVSGSGNGKGVVDLAATLAAALGANWHAIFIETPRSINDPSVARRAADALSLAARRGATVSNEPAADVAAGLTAHLSAIRTSHLVMGAPSSAFGSGWLVKSLVAVILKRHRDLTVHMVPAITNSPPSPGEPSIETNAGLRQHLYALSLVAMTLGVAVLASLVLGGRSLNLLFLFPVIAAAARWGLAPALTATAASVLSFDFFLLKPRFQFEPTAPAVLLLLASLVAVGIYTSLVTRALRSRASLSDRSAQENARIAIFSQSLARATTWDETAHMICDEIGRVLNAQVAVFRQLDGQIVQVGATSATLTMGAIDQAALNWCWEHGEPTGRGTTLIATADWRVEPLRTSLGVLAMLAVARSDGRDPVRADRELLFRTLVSQAALAHERLVLEDRAQA